MKRMKKLGALALATAMTASLTVPAFAATYTYIDDVEIIVTSNIEAGMYGDETEVSIDVKSGEINGIYWDDYEDVKVTNEPAADELWGEVKPKVSITLYAEKDDDWRFDTSELKKGETVSVKFNGEEANYTISSKTSTKLKLTVTLPEVKYATGYWETELAIDDLTIDEYTGIATWEENESVEYYEVKAYRGTKALTGIEKVTTNEYDLSQYFTREGEYRLRVRGVYDDYKGDWTDEYLDVDEEEAEDIYANWDGTTSSSSSSSSSNNTASGPQGSTEGAWMYDGTGWWWCNADRTYPSSTWKEIEGKWYYFDAVGYCVLNRWIQSAVDANVWYYCGPSGDMWTNRTTPDGYWVDANGVWRAN